MLIIAVKVVMTVIRSGWWLLHQLWWWLVSVMVMVAMGVKWW